jgi:arylsulfatase A-like enzyme
VGKPIGHLRKHREWALQDKTWERWWQDEFRMYYANISYLDACCGVILDALARTGLDRNTVVVFANDHADSMGSHQHFEKGGTMHEEVYRIPLIIRWPGVTAPGSSRKGFVRLLDLMPTFISMAGGTPLNGIGGVDISLLLSSETTSWFDSVYTEYHGNVWGPYTQRMVCTDNYKYVYNPYDIDELYDLTIDPWEMTNRIDDPSHGTWSERLAPCASLPIVRIVASVEPGIGK